MSSNTQQKVLILGAGCCGLGAAYRLQELGHENYLVLEQRAYPGGLAASFADGQGFTWDIGGHVQFSHYDYFDRVMDAALGMAWLSHVRQSYIWTHGRFIPYPFQNNLRQLPKPELVACVRGLIHAQANGVKPPENFRQWIIQSFGDGIADIFLLPYNFKVWGYPPECMGYQWVGERVARVDLGRVMENILLDKDDPGWGPNSTFRFPLRGGTGAIWRAVAGMLPKNRVHYGVCVTAVDAEKRVVKTAAGTEYSYDALISSLPVDCLSRAMGNSRLIAAAERLRYSSTHVVGVGVAGAAPEHLREKNWLYFPESDCPFYRATIFSSYSPNNVPDPARYWSVMAEVAESPHKPVECSRVVDNVVAGMKNTGVLRDTDRIASTWWHRADRGYPIPTVDRDEHVGLLISELEKRDVYSRGRFGAWRYEVSNQDHSFMQGVEAVDRILRGTAEVTVRVPHLVNAEPRLRQAR